MSYPVPDRLEPIRREVYRQIRGVFMLAVLSFVAFLLALFHVHLGDVDLVVLGLTLLAAHFAFASYVPTFGRRTP